MCHPLAFRQHVFKVKAQENLSYRQTAARFCIGLATLFRGSQRLEPKTKRNRKPSKMDDAALLAQVKKHPDLYHYERARQLGVQPPAIGKALKRLGITRKKNQPASKSR